ncbi:hypothetical protein IFT73_12720 [Aeromicrobium sp. CFBP 8757]|uniref:hypothetical protein n=1 Tax=Aeromicrobium sp. CFBP 8757 TaxID=2775288 RepID=UPI0017859479|nr:hypothetical protein [Aeromicrobium sp. CFBP 8757]MBD8607719.1 hypothetical protein [Aeromicrobium sp. CFBP 8757]
MAAVAAVSGVVVMGFALSTLLLGGSEAEPRAETTVAVPSVDTPEYVAPSDAADTDRAGSPTSGLTGIPGFPGAGATLTGLGGEGGVKGLPKMRITLSMTSAAPIAYVGYIVPTSLDSSTGTVESPGTSWSMTTIGYGPPDYAQLFSIAGPAGIPVTCTITVNGEVTEQRTTTGPYDQMFCQG